MSGLRDGSLLVLTGIAAVWLLQSAQEVFVPLVLGLLVSYALEPVVSRLEKLHVPRFLGSALLLLGVAGLIGLGVWVLSDDMLAIVESLPRAARTLEQTVRADTGEGIFEKIKEAATAIETTATEATEPSKAPEGVTRIQIEEKPIDLGGILLWGSVGILSGLGQLVLLFFLVYFLLLSGDLFRKKFVRIAGPALPNKRVTIDILKEINTQIERYVLVQVLVGAVVAVASALAFKWIGLERALFWGLAAGLFNSIPYFGPVLVSGGVAVVAFLQFGTLEMAIWVVLIATAITTLEGWLLTPLLLGKAARMNGVAVFVGLLFWTWVWGVWGLLLAVPMLVVVKSVCERIHELKPIAELLGE